GRLNNSWDQWSGTDNTIDAQIEVILTSGQRKNLMLPVAAERWGSGAMNPTISLNDLGEALVRVDSNR
ncbi:MAG: hypothetical protein FWD93_05005, partial [Coriobacteriia bacterium]|nr:hypothetical protein [Coriobacteriia bacterium]